MRQLIAFLILAALAALPGARADSNGSMPQRNVYAAGGDVRLAAPVAGDFIAAGGRVTIDQPVGRDVNVAGGSVDVRAAIGEDLRAVGGDVAIAASVGGELFAAGGNVVLRPGASIAGPARVEAGSATLEGRIGGDLAADAQKLTINGEVHGDVQAAAEEIEIGPAARITGTINYAAASELKKAPGAVIAGAITRTDMPRARHERRQAAPGTFWAGGVFTFAALLACSALLLLVAPGFGARAPRRIQHAPWVALGLGVATVLGVPLLAVLLCITLLGIPLGIAVMALYPALLLAGFLVGALFVASLLPAALRRTPPTAFGGAIGYIALALVLLLLAARVPFAGGLVLALVTMAGLGACVLEWRGRGKTPDAQAGEVAAGGHAVGPSELPRHA